MSYNGYILCILTVFVFRLFSTIIEFSLEANVWVFSSAFLNNSIIFRQHRTILLDQLVALSQTQCIQLRPLTGNTYLLSLVLEIQNEEALIFLDAIFPTKEECGIQEFPIRVHIIWTELTIWSDYHAVFRQINSDLAQITNLSLT